MPEVSNLYALDGFQYGVRYGDGSISLTYRGSTQLQRCVERVARLKALYPRDTFHVVRRARGTTDWITLGETC